ncbi:MAG: aminotransferase class I/II-fold pyridoxal phosphate-dependent enzyme [Parcubacteria group bacterium]|nr:aminotransferase class I/II-fold pyridoxal phosphate-dependent enzyme [Parcubacteria group bacterium]
MRIPTANTSIGQEEIEAVMKLLKENVVTPGSKVREFEDGITRVFGKKHGVMVNSGSSANLLALYAHKKPGLEVITPALTFGTTVAPILQAGMKPKFFDSEADTYVIDVDAVEEYVESTPNVERIFMIPALVGNLPDLTRLRDLSRKHGSLFILDSCDTNGALFDGKPIGTYADIATSSFYSTHIITAGGGGGVIMTDDDELKSKLQVLRGWGRASAGTLESEDINVRFNYSIDGIPYDSKLAFKECGFNMQVTEMQGTIAVEQLKKLPEFMRIRKATFKKIFDFFKTKPYFITPKQHPKTDTLFINFPLTLTPDCPFTRQELVVFLENHDVQTRALFSGNITRHPGFRDLVGGPIPFKNADYIMKNSLLIGCHQGLTDAHLEYLFSVFDLFLKEKV